MHSKDSGFLCHWRVGPRYCARVFWILVRREPLDLDPTLAPNRPSHLVGFNQLRKIDFRPRSVRAIPAVGSPSNGRDSFERSDRSAWLSHCEPSISRSTVHVHLNVRTVRTFKPIATVDLRSNGGRFLQRARALFTSRVGRPFADQRPGLRHVVSFRFIRF